MQSVSSTRTAKSFKWPVINGYAITVARSWRGAGRSALVTVSPCGLTKNPGSGRSLYRRGFMTRERATKFFLADGTGYAKGCNGQIHIFAMPPLSKLIRIASLSLTFTSLRSTLHQDGSRMWLCTPVLAIKRRR